MWGFTSKWADWERDGFATRSAVIARALARDPRVHRLLVVDAPSSIFAKANRGQRMPEHGEDRGAFHLRHAEDGAYVVEHTRLLPRERHHALPYAINSRLFDSALVKFVNRSQAELGMSAPVLWFTGPLGLHLTGSFGERVVVYDAVDDWTAHPAFSGMNRQLEEGYREVRRSADLVFAVSNELVTRFVGGRPSVLLSPNGADATRFATAHPVPQDLALLPKPVVGYVGALHRRFDDGLLCEVASRMPDVSFALVGRDDPSTSKADRPGNIHRLGFRPAESVPSYVTNFDACIVPHTETQLTKSMDPMKVYEFLAAGRPVVGSRVSSLERFDGLLKLAETTEEFVTGLRQALDGEWRPDEKAVRQFVERNTWERRIDEMLDAIEMRMAG